jgi:hypothetical protein
LILVRFFFNDDDAAPPILCAKTVRRSVFSPYGEATTALRPCVFFFTLGLRLSVPWPAWRSLGDSIGQMVLFRGVGFSLEIRHRHRPPSLSRHILLAVALWVFFRLSIPANDDPIFRMILHE